MKKVLALLGIVIALTGCQSVKEKTSAVGDFFDALGRGDIEFFKKQKKAKEVEDGSWEEVDNER